jgi:hypothetical protein
LGAVRDDIQLGKALGEKDEDVTAGGLSRIDVVDEKR